MTIPTHDSAVPSEVEALARIAGVAVDPPLLRAAAMDVARSLGHAAQVVSVAARCGVRVETVACSVDEVLGGAVDPALPLVARLPDGRRAVVVARRRTALRVEMGGEPARWISREHAARAVGASDVGARVEFVTAVAASPLDALAEAHRDAHPSAFDRLRALVLLERRELWVIVVYAAAVGLTSLVMPIAVQALVTTVMFGTLLQPVLVLVAFVAASLIFAGILRLFQAVAVEQLQRRVFARAAMDVAHRMPRVSLERFDHGSPAELVNRFFDAVALQKSVATLMLEGLAVALQMAIGMIVLGFYHPLLLAFDVVFVGSLLVLLFVVGRGGPRAFIESSRAKYEVASWLEQLAHHPVAFKSNGGPDWATTRTSDLVRRYLVKRAQRFSVVFRQATGSLALHAIASAGLLGVGGWFVLQRQLSVGQLVAAEIIVASVVEGLPKLAKLLESVYDSVASVDKIGHLVDLPLERQGGELCSHEAGAPLLALRAVGYALDDTEHLRAIDLEVREADAIAIVGEEGAGKTLLADLLYGLRSPSSGTLRAFGLDSSAIDVGALRSRVALARGIEVVDGTVLENVLLGNPLQDRSAARAALESVELSHDIERLAAGEQAHLVRAGGPLSSGQERRLMLARAFASGADVIVVDDLLDGVSPALRERILRRFLERSPRPALVLFTRDERLARMLPKALRLEGKTLRPLEPAP